MKNKYKVVTKLPKFDSNKPLFLDIEADVRADDKKKKKLYTLKIKTLQVLQDKVTYILDYDQIGDKLFDEAQKLNKYEIVAHWAIIDFIYSNIRPKKTHDTFMLAREAYPELSKLGGYSLDNVYRYIFHKDPYKELDKKNIRMTFHRGKPLTKEQLEYASLDCHTCKRIYKAIKSKSKVYKLNALMLNYSLQISDNSLLVDLVKAREELNKIDAEIESNYKLLNGINPNSPPQVFNAIGKDTGKTIVVENVKCQVKGKTVYKDKEYKVRKYKGYKFIKTDKTSLLNLIAKGNKLAKVVFDQRRLLKAKNMLESYTAKPINDNVAECKSYLYPMGTYTNRYSGTGFDLFNGINAQQITRKYQYLFHQPTNDTVVIHADYSTAEVRLACMVMNEKNLAKILREGVDVHKYTASVILDKPLKDITKEERQQAKAVVFGLSNKGSIKSYLIAGTSCKAYSRIPYREVVATPENL